MTSEEKNEIAPLAIVENVVHGTGSVAHQIIGEFLSALESEEGFTQIAKDLGPTFFGGKVTEVGLRFAMFGIDEL